ncbi:hypothetical protein PsorP6_002099 [Peronosclerospora sorghi]|uniref:Uncharacterized protein n=1 Tax=Peronosclerospora sorghi TaxID=230839 RepID=A0ACC0WPN7_9STRA|nr:hypothetical protein PsorP6_002099 [Peronosclerospora sorghi]
MYADENEAAWYNREVENGSPWEVPPIAEATLLNHGGRRAHMQDKVSETKAHELEHDKDYNLEQEPARLPALVYARARVRRVTGLDRAKRDHVALREGVETTVTTIILAYASTVAHSPMRVPSRHGPSVRTPETKRVALDFEDIVDKRGHS